MTVSGWYGVDLDGTLAIYEGWKGPGFIGAPIERMVVQVQEWIKQGIEVRIFTARVCVVDGISEESGAEATHEFAEQQRALIQAWCLEHVGKVLPVTAQKDWACLLMFDDRAYRVELNTGKIIRSTWNLW